MTFWRHMFVGWLIACAALIFSIFVEGATGWDWPEDALFYGTPVFGGLWIALWLWRNSNPSAGHDSKI